MKMQEESEKAGLKLNIQKTKIMASSPITSQQIDGETMETVSLYLLGLKKKKKAETLFYQQRSVSSKLCFFQQLCMDVRVGPES